MGEAGSRLNSFSTEKLNRFLLLILPYFTRVSTLAQKLPHSVNYPFENF